jgi:hypothetical protein
LPSSVEDPEVEDEEVVEGDKGSFTAIKQVEESLMPNFRYDSPMLLLGERRNTSSEWGVRVLERDVWCAWRARKVAERKWAGDRIWGVSVDGVGCGV